MPLADFIAESMELLGTDADEILVERVKPLRNNAGPNEAAFFNKFQEMIAQADSTQFCRPLRPLW